MHGLIHRFTAPGDLVVSELKMVKWPRDWIGIVGWKGGAIEFCTLALHCTISAQPVMLYSAAIVNRSCHFSHL